MFILAIISIEMRTVIFSLEGKHSKSKQKSEM